MNCTCSIRQYPCPIHKDKHLPETEEMCMECIVVRIYKHWPKNTEKGDIRWRYTITNDAIQTFDSKAVFLSKPTVQILDGR